MFYVAFVFIKKNLAYLALSISGILLLLSQLRLHSKQQFLDHKVVSYEGLSFFVSDVPVSIPLYRELSTQNSNIVYLRLTDNGCRDCTDSLLSNAAFLSSKIGPDNIVVLVSSTFGPKSFDMFRRLNQFTIKKIFYVANGISKLDSLKTSYYFTLHGRGNDRASSIFLPDPTGNPDLNRNYLNWVVRSFD